MNDFELEKHYHSENFMSEEELEYQVFDLFGFEDYEKANKYDLEVSEVILEGIKI